jgi:outer membrane protein OmpA-like peptidoglycan-associated protein
MAEMTATHIEIHDRIYFESGSAEIQPRSFGILNQVVTILKDNPQVTKVRIDGHTDNVGDETFNYDLSQRRVDSVRKYMIEKGIDASRLEARGNSELKPIASNDTPAGRARNRRVQFTILEVDGKPLPEVKE